MKKERKEYEQKYHTRYKPPKPGEKKSTSRTKHDVALGRLTLSPHFNANRSSKLDDIREYEQKYLSRYKEPKTKKNVGSDLYKPEIPKPKTDRRKERKKYEQKYLSRYKEPKPGVKKSTSWTQHDVALGRLALSPHFNAKRRAKQDEIREYEKQYLSRYKEPKPKKRAIQLEWEPEPKQDIKKERKNYERKYVSKFTKLQKTKLKIAALEQKLRLSQIELEEPKTDRKKERKDYEKEFLARYKIKQKAKPKKNVSKLLTPEPKIDRKKERKEYENEFLTRYKKQQ